MTYIFAMKNPVTRWTSTATFSCSRFWPSINQISSNPNSIQRNMSEIFFSPNTTKFRDQISTTKNQELYHLHANTYQRPQYSQPNRSL